MYSSTAATAATAGEADHRRSYWGLLHKYLAPRRRPIALLSAMLLTVTALQAAKPQVVRLFIDQTQSAAGSGAPAATNYLLLLAGGFALMGLGERALHLGSAHLGTWLSWDAANALRRDILGHCLRLPMSFHASRAPGELVERLDGDVTTLGGFMSELFLKLLANGLLVVTIIALMLREDPRLGLGFMAYAVLTVLALGALGRQGRIVWGRSRASRAQQTSCTEELLAAREDLIPNGAAGYADNRIVAAIQANLSRRRAAAMMGAATSGTNRLLQTIGLVIGIGIVASLHARGLASIGTAYLVVSYAALLAAPLDAVRRQLSQLQLASAGAGRILGLLALPGAEDDAQTPRSAVLPAGPLALELRQVSFRYDSAAPAAIPDSAPQPAEDAAAPHAALTNVSLSLLPGQTLGLVGRTGSGKTTLARLLLGLYVPASGEIILAGRPLSEIPLGELRRRVGLVTQDVQLLSGTVRDNVTLYDPDIADETVITLLAQLGLAGWLGSLPAGLDTHLSAGGLSAGEAQLLSIARLLLRDPGLIVLDEAAARLDPATEHLLDGALRRLLPGRTVVVIAHRLETMERMDQLVIMSAGQVVERGSPAQLAAESNSAYARLRRAGGDQEVLRS